ncbi:MAG: DUF4897 domain-containing protein [Halobacteriaceae archaeon]
MNVGTAAISPERSRVNSVQSFDADAITLRADILQNGSAQWTIQYRIKLNTENETAAFKELQQDIAANREKYISDFAAGIRATVNDSENVTGRQMEVTHFQVSTQLQTLSNTGIVTYTFIWRGFAKTRNSKIIAGDALRGLYLDQNTTLIFTWPESYQLESVSPDPTTRESNLVSWAGSEVDFSIQEPRLVVDKSKETLLPGYMKILIGGFLLLILSAGAFFVYHRNSRSFLSRLRGDTTAESTTTSESTSQETESERPPSELLSNEEQVLQLLEQNNGRMKQQDIVDRLDWTEAKTSQVVNKMKEQDDIEVFRIGRENILRLPEEESGEEDGS